MSFRYRCPRCNAIPWNPSGPVIPHHCKKCKAPCRTLRYTSLTDTTDSVESAADKMQPTIRNAYRKARGVSSFALLAMTAPTVTIAQALPSQWYPRHRSRLHSIRVIRRIRSRCRGQSVLVSIMVWVVNLNLDSLVLIALSIQLTSQYPNDIQTGSPVFNEAAESAKGSEWAKPYKTPEK